MAVAIATYPDFEPQVRELVRQHRELRPKALRLAVYFAPPRRKKRDLFLFEVIDGFGNDEVDAGRKLFEFSYGSTPGLPLPEGSKLQMVLTNPKELDEAIHEEWKAIQELRAAREAGQAIVIHADAAGRKLWSRI